MSAPNVVQSVLTRTKPQRGLPPRSLSLAEDDQNSCNLDAEEEAKHLRNRIANMTYRLSMEEFARLHTEIMYKAAVEHCIDRDASLRTLQNENLRLQQSVDECGSLEQQLDREYDLRRSCESHAAHLTDALKLMGRILQVQYQLGVEDLPQLLLEKASIHRDIEKLKIEASRARAQETPSSSSRSSVNEEDGNIN